MLGKAVVSSPNYFQARSTLKPYNPQIKLGEDPESTPSLHGMPKIVGIPSFEMTSQYQKLKKKNLFRKVLFNYTRKIEQRSFMV